MTTPQHVLDAVELAAATAANYLHHATQIGYAINPDEGPLAEFIHQWATGERDGMDEADDQQAAERETR